MFSCRSRASRRSPGISFRVASCWSLASCITRKQNRWSSHSVVDRIGNTPAIWTFRYFRGGCIDLEQRALALRSEAQHGAVHLVPHRGSVCGMLDRIDEEALVARSKLALDDAQAVVEATRLIAAQSAALIERTKRELGAMTHANPTGRSGR